MRVEMGKRVQLPNPRRHGKTARILLGVDEREGKGRENPW